MPPGTENPLITVVTVVRNGRRSIEQTIQSVLKQSYENVEYIVIDGASTDGTQDIISYYKEKIAYWVSEPDEGIYDAMNKGIEFATGEWINFMNAGDTFYSNNVLENIFHKSDKYADVIYGDHVLVYNADYSRRCRAGEVKDLWRGMIFCHQSSFVKTSLMKKNMFNCRFRIAADFEVLYSLALTNHTFHNTGLIIASVAADGLSGVNTLAAVMEQRKIVVGRSGTMLKNGCYIYFVIKRIGKDIIKAILPKKIVNRIRVKL